MTKTTKRSNAEIADELLEFVKNVRASISEGVDYARKSDMLWVTRNGIVGMSSHGLEVAKLEEAAAKLRVPTIAADDAEAANADSVEYANKVQSNLSSTDAFVWMIARNAYLAGRAALEAAIAVHNKEQKI